MTALHVLYMYCTALHCTCCVVLHYVYSCTVLSTVLYCTVLCCTVKSYTPFHSLLPYPFLIPFPPLLHSSSSLLSFSNPHRTIADEVTQCILEKEELLVKLQEENVRNARYGH